MISGAATGDYAGGFGSGIAKRTFVSKADKENRKHAEVPEEYSTVRLLHQGNVISSGRAAVRLYETLTILRAEKHRRIYGW